MDRAELRSLSALTDLDNALGHFGGRARECLQAAESSVRRQMAQLTARREEAERQVHICEINLAEASEDEVDEAERRLKEAMERLSLVRRWQSRAEEAFQVYLKVARHLEQTASEHIPRVQLKLRTKHDEAAAYVAAQVEGDVPPAQRSAAPPPSQAAPTSIETPKLDSLVQFPLPPASAGYRWSRSVGATTCARTRDSPK